MTEIFCELLQIKEPQRYKIEELLYRTIGKCRFKTQKNPGIEVAHFNCTGEMRVDNFGCLNSSLSLFYVYFVTNLRKKVMTYVRLQLNLPLPPYEPVRF